MGSARVVFGLVTQERESELPARWDALFAWIVERHGIALDRRASSSYEALARAVRAGEVDVAWLPPIVYVRLADAVCPLGSVLRGRRASYQAALVVPERSRIRSLEGLRGTRAGWVDRWSAAGFVMPRMKLSLLGVDPRTAFRTETFHGSHRAALRALADGACDVVGTYARDEDGEASGDTTGAWSEMPGVEVRILAMFGAIPPDVIAARADLDESVRDGVLAALADACDADENEAHLRAIFGGRDFHRGLAAGYDALEGALAVATSRGLFD